MVRNKTLLDFEAQVILSRRSNIGSQLIGVLAGLIFLFVGIFAGESTGVFRYIAIAFGIIIIVVFLVFWPKIVESAVKKGRERAGDNPAVITNSYVFDDNRFQVKSSSEGRTFAESTHFYKDLKEVQETPNSFIIYVSFKRVYYVRKSGTKDGGNDLLSEYLKQAKKYVLKKK